MTFLIKYPARIGSLLLCTALACSGAQAQNTARPDLEGVWSNASLTNLTRSRGLESLVVTAEEALVIAAGVPIGGIEGGFDDGDGVNNTPDVAGDDFGTRAYNHFWVDPGSNLALVKGEYRTSYIINPENGQVPRLEKPRRPAAREGRDGRGRVCRESRWGRCALPDVGRDRPLRRQ